jgi:four helix bundle protein
MITFRDCYYDDTMMKRDRSLLLDKSESFSGRIVKMYQYLTSQKGEYVISKQVLRSGTSIGANISESRNAQSTPDFIHKLSIALKEADETVYWIKNLHYGNYINDKEYESIYHDANELVCLLVSSIKTLKRKNGISI